MVSNAFEIILESAKMPPWTFFMTFFNVIFNSKEISSSKQFSKLLLKDRNGLRKDRAAILFPYLGICFSLYFLAYVGI